MKKVFADANTSSYCNKSERDSRSLMSGVRDEKTHADVVLGERAKIRTHAHQSLGEKSTEPIASACKTCQMPTTVIPRHRFVVSGRRQFNREWHRDLRC
jgi:hypothetical protein